MNYEPLAYRMRPRTFDELVGQEHVLGPDTALYRMLQQGHVPSMIVYGPPGTGKTSFVTVLSRAIELSYVTLNATTASKQDIENAIGESRLSGKILLFIDEIHRLNKMQQDVLLPHVENGNVVLIGATTENPFHDVNPAIRSRCGEIVQFQPLKEVHILTLLQTALQDERRGFGTEKVNITEQQLRMIAGGTAGDVRLAYNALEDVVYSAFPDAEGVRNITDDSIAQCMRAKGFTHDKGGDHYYNLLSALQKSIRGSDTDAAIYYLARLIKGGDLTAIGRRLVIIAYEDCGLASPELGSETYLAIQAAHMVGFPEARIILANVVIKLCLSPKSNTAYTAINKALADLEKGDTFDPPPYLRDAHYAGSEKLGAGIGYKYPHDFPGAWTYQQYLPDELANRSYYKPKDRGQEQTYKAVYDKLSQLGAKYRENKDNI
ncbi:MAG: replication-associated recombination protein A [Bacilli bacterium]